MKEVILFIMTYIFILVIYEIFIVRIAKKNHNNSKKNKPIEIRYIMKKYNLTMKDIDYDQLLQIVALVSSLDIAIVVSVMFLIKNFVLELLIGVILLILLIIISYSIIGNKYRKKDRKWLIILK